MADQTLTRRVTVLAGGWSASQLDLHKLPGFVIAVNDAAIYAPRVDALVSMDRIWTENRFDKICRFARPVWLRRSTLKNIHSDGLDDIHLFECDHTSTTLSDEPNTLNGTHSGFCALNLAYQMRPAELYLVGFDMKRGPNNEAHWFPQYPWVEGHATGEKRLAEWGAQFDTAAHQLRAAGIATFLCGTTSAVHSFGRISRADLESAAQCAS
jgi:hypothetical protein